MKKLITFLVLLTVSVGLWAAASASQITASNNGKGFTYDQTAYAITTENAGDLATALASGSSISNLDMTDGTYFTFSGPLNAADLAALAQFGANSTADVYFDFSGATFVDEYGDPLTDTSLLTNLNNAKAKYIILPNTTTSVSESNFPSSVKEALAINGNKLFGYSSSAGGALEHVLAFDKRYAVTGNSVTDYTLVGTYTYIQDPSQGENPRGAATYSTLGLRNSVFGVIKRVSDNGYGSANIVDLDLSGATFPNYTDEDKTYQATEGISTWTGPTNGMELINIFASSLQSIKLPETEGTNLIPYKALYPCSHITTLEIPGNIETLGMECFYSMTGVTSITFNEGLKHMAPDVFLNCTSVTSIALPVGLEEIGDYAFIKCSSLRELTIPEGVKVIGAGAFEQTDIQAVRLPNSLVEIKENAFRECKKLRTITIPEKVEVIGSKAFWLCPSITDVYFLGTTTIPEVGADVFGGGLYYNSGACEDNAGGQTGSSSPRGNYDEALHTYTGSQWKVDYSCWATITNGEKTAGAAVLHYPIVNEEAGYAETDYAAAYASYQSDMDDYNAAVADKQEEVEAYEANYAIYLQQLEVYNAAANTTIYRRPSPDNLNWYEETTAQYVAEHSSEEFFVLESIGGYTPIQAWQTNNGQSYERGTCDYYTFNNGAYELITSSVTDYTSASNYENSTGLFVYDSTVKNYSSLDAATIATLAQGEPTPPTPVEGIPTRPTAPSVFVKSGDDFIAYTGAPEANVTYYKATEAVTDKYGEIYTVPARNASYGGVYVGGDSFEENHNLGDVWPDKEDLYCWLGSQGEATTADVGGRTGLPSPDNKNHDGTKNFLLVKGFIVDSPTSEVQVIEHMKKDVWYTICLPFDVNEIQLETAFGPNYEIAEFTSVDIDDVNETYTLNFTTNVTNIQKHHPYMIHPDVLAVDENGNLKETVFSISGVTITEEDLNKAPENMIKVNDRDGRGFTFVAYGHNYDNDSNGDPVVIPKWAFYLAQDPNLSYPMFYRQTGENSRTTGGRWTKNTAVVLPPNSSWGGYTDSRIIYNTSDEVLYGGNEATAYYNYLCQEYVLEKPASGGSGGSVKSMFINFTNEPINHDTDAIDIIESKTEAEQTTPAAYKDKIFNLSGQMVGNNADGLEKGIYIKNGKKFIVR